HISTTLSILAPAPMCDTPEGAFTSVCVKGIWKRRPLAMRCGNGRATPPPMFCSPSFHEIELYGWFELSNYTGLIGHTCFDHGQGTAQQLARYFDKDGFAVASGVSTVIG